MDKRANNIKCNESAYSKVLETNKPTNVRIRYNTVKSTILSLDSFYVCLKCDDSKSLAFKTRHIKKASLDIVSFVSFLFEIIFFLSVVLVVTNNRNYFPTQRTDSKIRTHNRSFFCKSFVDVQYHTVIYIYVAGQGFNPTGARGHGGNLLFRRLLIRSKPRFTRSVSFLAGMVQLQQEVENPVWLMVCVQNALCAAGEAAPQPFIYHQF